MGDLVTDNPLYTCYNTHEGASTELIVDSVRIQNTLGFEDWHNGEESRYVLLEEYLCNRGDYIRFIGTGIRASCTR